MAAKRKWSAGYTDAKGKRHRKQFNSKIEAEVWEAEGRAEAAKQKAAKAEGVLSRVAASSEHTQ